VSLVSVIMPTHNAAGWVAQAIDSVIAQTYAPVELIVVDDASQDDTVKTIRAKLERDFKGAWQILELPKNQGPSAARNIGLRAASGAWVQYLDSDDLLAPSKLERQMAVCAGAPDDVAAVFSPFRMCHIDDGRIEWAAPLVACSVAGLSPVMCMIGGFRPLHSAGLARRSVLEKIGGFDESLRFWECEEINVRLAQAGRLMDVPTPEPAYLWRIHRAQSYIGGAAARYRAAPVALGWITQVLRAADGRTLDALGLSGAERQAVRDDCTMWGRLVFAQDRVAFREFLAMARRLTPDIAPSNPAYIRWASRYVGYEAAETMARLVRAPKALARRIVRRLTWREQTALFDYD
jgi:hypothetical protein